MFSRRQDVRKRSSSCEPRLASKSTYRFVPTSPSVLQSLFSKSSNRSSCNYDAPLLVCSVIFVRYSLIPTQQESFQWEKLFFWISLKDVRPFPPPTLIWMPQIFLERKLWIGRDPPKQISLLCFSCL